MIALKIYFHIISFFKRILYKIIYGKKIKFGKNISFRKGFSILIEKDGFVEIGDGCFFNNYCSINSHKAVKIGNNCIFGENVKIYDHNHIFKYKGELIKKQGFKTGKIIIENNCWIGSNSVILKNVNIGSNSVIAAGEVVKENVGANKLYRNAKEEEIKFTQKV